MTATPLPKAEAITAPPESALPDRPRPRRDRNRAQVPWGDAGVIPWKTGLEKSDPPTANPSVSWMQALKARLGFEAAPTLRDTLEDALLAEAKTASVFTEQERGMLLRILRFGGLRVEDVRVPRVDIIAIDEQEPLSALLQLFAKAEVSRIPVYRDTLDDPRGMIHIKDLMSWLVRRGVPGASVATAPPDDGVAKSMPSPDHGATRLADVDVTIPIANARINRPVLYVPPSMPAVNLLLRMQSTHIHLAIVVDEHGGTDGLVSIEDLVEQIVGEIEDEHDDDDDRNIVTDPRHGLVAAGRTPIKDLEAHLGVSIADEEATEDVTSIGGLIYALIGRIPAAWRAHSSPLRDRIRSAGCRYPAREASEDPSTQAALMAPLRAPNVRDRGRNACGRSPGVMAKADAFMRRRPRLAAIVCGALSTLAMPPVFAWPVLFATFYGLVRPDRRCRCCAVLRGGRGGARYLPSVGCSALAISSLGSTGSAPRCSSSPTNSFGSCRFRPA